ncbi:MAG: ATP synthase F0 subunit B [Acidobacteriota bacterium]|nr:ATP synthase F0 subunit B [Acidobacteriota bacterium]
MKQGWMRTMLPLLLLVGLAAPTALRAQDVASPAPVVKSTAAETGKAGEGKAESKPEQDEDDAYLHSASVKALGAKLGMNSEQAATAFQVVNFAILAVLLGGALIKALPKIFRSRNEAIQRDLVSAKAATDEAKSRLGNVEARLAKLDEQIAAMRAQAEKDAAAEELRIKASAEAEQKKILEVAEQEIAAASAQAQRQLQRYAAELAVEQAARKLVVTAETDRLLVQGFARKLAGDGSKEGQN